MVRVPGKAATKLSLYTRAHALKPTADPLEAKREAAEIQSTAARLVMTRHRIEQLRGALVERDRNQSEVGAATVELIEQLASTIMLEKEILQAIGADLGDLQIEALRVTDEKLNLAYRVVNSRESAAPPAHSGA